MNPEQPVVEQVAGMGPQTETFKSFVVLWDGRAFFDYTNSYLIVIGRAWSQGVAKVVLIRRIDEKTFLSDGPLDHAWRHGCEARDEIVNILREKLGTGSSGWDGES